MPRATQTPWSLKAEEMLADGEWHDGLALCRKVERLITPGPALRQTERLRINRRVNAGASREDVLERTVERRESTLIAMGKRSLSQKLVHSRVRSGSWEIDPPSFPESAWRHGGWRLRAAARQSVRELSRKYRMAPATLRQLVLAEPAVPHRAIGRILWVEPSGIPELEARIAAYREGEFGRRSAAMKRARAEFRGKERDYITLTDFAEKLGTSPHSLRKVLADAPEGTVIRRGRTMRIPLDQVEVAGELYYEWRAGITDRRMGALRAGIARRDDESSGDDVQFDDPQLTDTYGRYRAGETELREAVLADMRRAFHEAPEV